MAVTEAALLREVARLQRDKTLLAVRDIVDSIPVAEYDKTRYRDVGRSAENFRKDLLRRLKALKEAD